MHNHIQACQVLCSTVLSTWYHSLVLTVTLPSPPPLPSPPVTQLYDYVFSENGLVAYKDGQHFSTMSIKENMGEANIKTFVNFCLRYMASLDIPKKRC